ncbi:MAG: DUF2934 domain-containing protein [Candidatus Omnitrophica bacterium]|nr:DUF2934 domain-containing protein [Candidatus Omnitrophota bacterium]
MMKKVINKISKKRSMASSRSTRKAKSSGRSSAGKARRKSVTSTEFMNLVERKAYEMWESRGYGHGGDQGDWYEAEKAVNSLYKVK